MLIWPLTIATLILWSTQAFCEGLSLGDVYPAVSEGTGRHAGEFIVTFQDTLRSQCKEELVSRDGSVLGKPRVVHRARCERPELTFLGELVAGQVVRRRPRGSVTYPSNPSEHQGKPWYQAVTHGIRGPRQALSWGNEIIEGVLDMRLTSTNVIVLARAARDPSKVTPVSTYGLSLGLGNKKIAVYWFERGNGTLQQMVEIPGVANAADFPAVSRLVEFSDSEFGVSYISERNEVRYAVVNLGTSKSTNVLVGLAGAGFFNVSAAAIGRSLLIAYHSNRIGEEKNTIKLVGVTIP